MIAMTNDLTLDFAAAVAEDLKRTRGEHGYYENRDDAVSRRVANFVWLPPLDSGITLSVVPFETLDGSPVYAANVPLAPEPTPPLSFAATLVVNRMSHDASCNPAVSGGRVGIRQVDDGRVEVVMVVDVDSGEPVAVEAK